MIYRTKPAAAPRMLLAITYGVGAGVLLGAAACSSPNNGSNPGATDPCGPSGVCGVVAMPQDASGDADAEATDPCASHGVCGVVAMPQDASGDADVADGGAEPDSASDAQTNPCGIVCGLLIMPTDASNDATGED